MVKMPNNDVESEDSGPDVASSSESEDFSSDNSTDLTENEIRIGRKIADYNEVLGK